MSNGTEWHAQTLVPRNGGGITMKKLATVLLATLSFVCSVQALVGTYTTTFRLTENPISEGGRWINGRTVGLDWQDVRTTSGLAYGTQSGSSGTYDDSTAVLTGAWGRDQTVQAVAHAVPCDCGGSEEVEIRLRTTITAHSITGYEINFSTGKGVNPGSYMQIVRWNGAIADFTVLATYSGIQFGAAEGDVLKATISGTSPATITAYVNGTQMGQATDSSPFTSGSPGMGFWLQSPALNPADYGFKSFTASDGGGAPVPSAPSNLRIIP
jgi:hypothetical protein